ncbi:MAG: cysteine--tRNA ligase [Candidatus Paceibacterota bacterium]
MTPIIKLHNTKSRTTEEFKPITEGKVGMYSCGPTVYHYQHLGNMRAVVFADTLHNMFLSAGYDVTHVINITDVGHLVTDGDTGEDKMEKGSKREGKTVWEIADFYTKEYFHCLDLLNINRSEYIFPRATDTIPEQIALVQTLEEKGYTYAISDGIYFDTSKFPRYADFAHLDIEGLQSGARVEENTEKKNITDFALWKFSHSTRSGQVPKNEQRQMEWDSPWGKGFPGWHIECSAMSKKILGPHFDIHTGGIDHIPVHHTNEIAQSECANGETYVNYWMHNNFLNDTAGKMAKSSGEFLRLQTLVDKGYDPIAFRYYLLTTHYRKELAFSFEALDASSVAYKKLWDWSAEHITHSGVVNQNHTKVFLEALYDDLGTSTCIAEMWALLKDEQVNNEDKYATLMEMSSILGFSLHKASKEMLTVSKDVEALLDARLKARLAKDFAEADRLRDELKKLGYSVKDTGGGQEISK